MKKFSWIIFLLLVVFLILPIVLLFKESVMGKRPFTEEEFKKSIQAVLKKVPEEQKSEWLSEWIDQLSDSKKIEFYMSSLKTTSKRESLNFQGLSFKDLEEQIKGLDRSDLEKFNQTLMLEVCLSKARSIFI